MSFLGGKSIGVALVAAFVSASSLGATRSLGATSSGERLHEARTRVAPMADTFVDLDVDKIAGAPYRAHLGRTDVYMPTFFEPKDGKYDLIIHFHGLSAAQESNIERTRINAVVASVNLGVGSGPYEHAFKDAWSFPALVNIINKSVMKSGRANGAHIGRIALSAWSAGYGSVSAILRQPQNVKRVDAVLLADGLHSDYAGGERRHIVDEAPLVKYAKIAEAAIAGEKLFALTHSSIVTSGYPNTTDTIGELLKMVHVPKAATVSDGPRGMLEVYESHSGDFHVKGFLGTQVKDHIDHIWGMNDTMLPYLRDRWTATLPANTASTPAVASAAAP